MFTVALIGVDGAGKTTVGSLLEAELGLPVKTIYMGVNLHSSSVMLPHTRALLAIRRRKGGTDPEAVSDIKTYKPPPETPIARFGAAVRSGLRLTNWLAEEWYRQAVAASYTRRGSIVVFDRHFFADYYAEDIREEPESRSLSQRIHGYVLQHLYPRPTLVICLDAPAEVLYARKAEGSLERLREKREEYLELKRLLPELMYVDAARPTDEVTKEVAAIIRSSYERRQVARRSRFGILRRRPTELRKRRSEGGAD